MLQSVEHVFSKFQLNHLKRLISFFLYIDRGKTFDDDYNEIHFDRQKLIAHVEHSQVHVRGKQTDYRSLVIYD